MTAIERPNPAAEAQGAPVHLLAGAEALRTRDLDAALAAFERALIAEPGNPIGFTGLGAVYLAKSLPAPAMECYRQALRLDPERAATWLEMALALYETGNASEALTAAARAASLDPALGMAHAVQGSAQLTLGDFQCAIAAFLDAERLMPDSPMPQKGIGTAYSRMRQWERARERFARAIQLEPDDVETISNLAACELEAGNPLRALELLERGLALNPRHPAALGNQSLAFARAGRYAEALAAAEAGARVAPDAPGVLIALGASQLGWNRIEDALATYRRLAELDPRNWEARFGAALALLVSGRWRAAWPLYDSRIGNDPSSGGAPNNAPVWSGEPLAGKSILVYAEQGSGDTIQSFRYIPALAARGADIVCQVQPGLKGLLGRMVGPRLVVASNEPVPPTDYAVAFLSLPRLFDTMPDTVPNPQRYLRADPARVAYWRGRLPATAGLLVGVAWAGNPKHRADRMRSSDLATFAPLMQVNGVRWVVLQPDVTNEERTALARMSNATHIGRELAGFDEIAAVVDQLDLVITVDTSFAHVAGALGVPVWTLLAFSPDWRWLLDRDDTPWYASMRLYRQRQIGDWSEPLGRVRTALQASVAATPRAALAASPIRRGPHAVTGPQMLRTRG